MELLNEIIANGLDGWSVLVLLTASFAGSFITASMGIGGGALLLGVMASIIPPAVLIAAHGVIQLGSNTTRAALFIRHVQWETFRLFAIGSVIGAVVGGFVSVELPPALVMIGVGLFIIWSVLAKPPRWLSGRAGIIGLISSFLTMFFGATGVFVANFIKSLNLGREAHVATHAMFMTLQHALKVVVFALFGVVIGPWLPLIAAMIVSGFAGTLLGRSVLLRMNDRMFRRTLDAILLLISLRLIWQGMVEF